MDGRNKRGKLRDEEEEVQLTEDEEDGAEDVLVLWNRKSAIQ